MHGDLRTSSLATLVHDKQRTLYAAPQPSCARPAPGRLQQQSAHHPVAHPRRCHTTRTAATGSGLGRKPAVTRDQLGGAPGRKLTAPARTRERAGLQDSLTPNAACTAGAFHPRSPCPGGRTRRADAHARAADANAAQPAHREPRDLSNAERQPDRAGRRTAGLHLQHRRGYRQLQQCAPLLECRHLATGGCSARRRTDQLFPLRRSGADGWHAVCGPHRTGSHALEHRHAAAAHRRGRPRCANRRVAGRQPGVPGGCLRLDGRARQVAAAAVIAQIAGAATAEAGPHHPGDLRRQHRRSVAAHIRRPTNAHRRSHRQPAIGRRHRRCQRHRAGLQSGPTGVSARRHQPHPAGHRWRLQRGRH